MFIKRPIFINKRTGQGSITLPKDVVDKLANSLKIKHDKRISLKILNINEAKN